VPAAHCVLPGEIAFKHRARRLAHLGAQLNILGKQKNGLD